MREYKQERTQKAKRIDKDGRYDEEETHVDAKALARFRAKPYGCVRKGSDTNGGKDHKN